MKFLLKYENVLMIIYIQRTCPRLYPFKHRLFELLTLTLNGRPPIRIVWLTNESPLYSRWKALRSVKSKWKTFSSTSQLRLLLKCVIDT